MLFECFWSRCERSLTKHKPSGDYNWHNLFILSWKNETKLQQKTLRLLLFFPAVLLTVYEAVAGIFHHDYF